MYTCRIIMSRFGRNYAASTSVDSTPLEHSSVIFTFVPNPGSDASHAKAVETADAIESLQKRVRDLSDPNKMTKTVQDCTCLYQTVETYGKAMSCEGIAEAMKENDLSLRVTFKRPGFHSSPSIFELNPILEVQKKISGCL